MKIAIFSDIHTEFWVDQYEGKLYPRHTWQEIVDVVFEQAAKADLLIAAGDLGVGTRGLQVLHEFVMKRNPNLEVVALAGNHEFYHRHLEATHRELAAEAKRLGIHWISPGTVELGGIVFIGATLWTDYRLFGDASRKACMQLAENSLRDHSVIRHGNRYFTAAQAAGRHKRERAFIDQQLTESAGKTCVVVTHHLPHMAAVSPWYQENKLSAAFASDLSELIGRHQPALWVYGHTHDTGDTMVGSTRLIGSPWGYPNETGCKPCVAEVELMPASVASDVHEPLPERQERTCLVCGWVHFAVSRKYAEDEVAAALASIQSMQREDQALYSPPSIKSYERCFRCGAHYKNTRLAREGDCPPLSTLQPIIADDI